MTRLLNLGFGLNSQACCKYSPASHDEANCKRLADELKHFILAKHGKKPGDKFRDAWNPLSISAVQHYMDEYAKTDDGTWIKILGYAREDARKKYKAAVESVKSAGAKSDGSIADAGGAAVDGAAKMPPGALLGEDEAYVQRQKIKELEAEVARLKGVKVDPDNAKSPAAELRVEKNARLDELERRFLQNSGSARQGLKASMLEDIVQKMRDNLVPPECG